MTFCTAVNCIDGRVQLPVIEFLTDRFGVDYVDMITEPGVNRILAERTDPGGIDSILARIDISVTAHNSSAVAVVGHHDCKGNPVDESQQTIDTLAAVKYLREQCARYKDVRVIGLWVDGNGTVSEITTDQ
ncbi:MAG: hypothetical protein QGG42_04160 [Phycisphaerae bacterium]|nr:hypothetical protein [Phycisphaerae bacterium]